MKDFGNTIYAVACVVTATILGIGVVDYWFDGHQFSSFFSWAVLAAIPWLIGYATLSVLGRVNPLENLPIQYRGRVGKAHPNSDRPTATS
ncbi:MAG: hypothetical protein WAK55_23645 [Xanthobacteraceae bacterium]